MYGLNIPIKTADPEHIKALRYFAAVYDAMTFALKADPNYSGLLTKNPTHANWRTYWGSKAAYELSELAEYVSLTNIQKRAESDSISKLPTRQFTRAEMGEDPDAFSKLPTRQFTCQGPIH